MAIEEHRPGTPAGSRGHRVHAFGGRAHEVLDDILGPDGSAYVALSELGVTATRESIVEISRLQDRLEALKARLLVHGDVLGIGTAADDHVEHGDRPVIPATSTAAWYSLALTKDRRTGKQAVKLAQRLADVFQATGRALGSGVIDAAQALVIVEAVDALPGFVGEFERRRAEKHLLAEAAHHDAAVLRRLGWHLLEVIHPDGVDEYLARKLQEEDDRAARRTFFEVRDDGQGTVHGRFAMPALNAAMLLTALHAIASPKRPDALDRETTDPSDQSVVPVPNAELLGQAFCEYVERFPTDHLPGGINATVVVTMDLDTLLGGIKAACVDTGINVSGPQARRLASQCGVIPAVLGSEGDYVDLGRKVRLHTATQRVALRSKHPTCTVEGCTVPSAWCHAHHKKPWARGGKTSLKNGTMLCPAHHRHAHQPGVEITYDGNTTRITKTVKRRQ